MTVVLVKDIKNFIGVSGDTKPTNSLIESTFYETDTGNTYIFDGINWVIKK